MGVFKICDLPGAPNVGAAFSIFEASSASLIVESFFDVAEMQQRVGLQQSRPLLHAVEAPKPYTLKP